MRKLIFVFIILITMGLILPDSVFAIGQMTKPIVFENVLRGQTVKETLILYGEEKDGVYGLFAEGEIKDWTSFYKEDDLGNPIKEINIPANSPINAIVKFNIPNDTPNGTYTGTVVLFSSPKKDEKSEGVSVSIGLRVDREVSITVTDKEILNFETTIIPLKYGISGGEPLKIKVIYDNQGNVAIKPDLQLKIIQISTGNIVHNAIYPYPEDEEPVRAFERREFPNLIEWQSAGQENGKYKAEIKVLLNGSLIKEESFRFDVGVDIMKLLLAAVSTLGGGNILLGWFVFGLIFVVIAGVLGLFYKKPQLLKVWIKRIKSIF